MALNINLHRENLIGVLAIDKAKHTLGLRLLGKNKQKNYIFNIKSTKGHIVNIMSIVHILHVLHVLVGFSNA